MTLPKINFNEHVFDENSFFELIRSTEEMPRYVDLHLYGKYVIPVRVVDIEYNGDKFVLSCVLSTTLFGWDYYEDDQMTFDIDFSCIDSVTLY